MRNFLSTVSTRGLSNPLVLVLIIAAVLAPFWPVNGQIPLALNDLCGDLSTPGPYGVGYTYYIEVSTPSRSFPAFISYPSFPGKNGANEPFNRAGGPYPILVFAHGWLQADESYSSYLQHYPTHGYFVVAPRADYFIVPNVTQFSVDCRLLITWLKAQNTNSSSPFFNQVDVSNVGIMGHSLGGVVSDLTPLVTPWDPTIKAIAPIAGFWPEQQYEVSGRGIPSLILAGDVDIFVPVVAYDVIVDVSFAPFYSVLVRGGWHCGYMDDCPELPGPLCRFPFEYYCPREPMLVLSRCLTTAFFDVNLKGNLTNVGLLSGPRFLALSNISLGSNPFIASQTMLTGAHFVPQTQVANLSSNQTQYKFSAVLYNDRNVSDSFKLWVSPLESSPLLRFELYPTTTPLIASHASVSIAITLRLQQRVKSTQTLTFYATSARDHTTSTFGQAGIVPI